MVFQCGHLYWGQRIIQSFVTIIFIILFCTRVVCCEILDRQWFCSWSVGYQVPEVTRAKLSSVFKAGWTSEDTCLKTIREVFEQTGYLMDTHTAVAKHVADQFISPNRPMIVAATAHYSKFASDVLTALNHHPGSHSSVELLKSLQQLDVSPGMHFHIEETVRMPEVHSHNCCASVEAIMTQIEKFLSWLQ